MLEMPTAPVEVVEPMAPASLAPPRRKRRMLVFVGIALVALLLAGAAIFALVFLCSRYTPQRAVAAYFAAQQHRDVDGMFANATFLRGEGAYSMFFDKAAVQAMMRLRQYGSTGDVKIV